MGSATVAHVKDSEFKEVDRRTVNLSDSSRIVFDTVSKPDIDYFLIVGRPAEIFGAVAKISGRSPLFPKWAMGFTNSQWGANDEWKPDKLTGLTEEKLRKIITDYRDKKIPIDGFTFDLDWMYWGGTKIDGTKVPNSQFTWNLERFPNMAPNRPANDPAKNLQLFAKNSGINLTVILKPRIPIESEEGTEATKKNWWMPHTMAVKDYFTPTFMRHVNFGNPEMIKWYTGKLGSLVDTGIAGWWNDEFGSSGATDGEGNETEGLDAQRGSLQLAAERKTRSTRLVDQP